MIMIAPIRSAKMALTTTHWAAAQVPQVQLRLNKDMDILDMQLGKGSTILPLVPAETR
jgi:hypothetical protein